MPDTPTPADPDLLAIWQPASGLAMLDAVDRRAWRGLGRVDGRPLAQGWQPPAFTLVTERDGAQVPVPDVIRTGAPAPVLSARAAEVLAPVWGRAVEWLPLQVDQGSWLLANPLEVVAALDPDRSEVRRFESSGRVMAIEAHVVTGGPHPPIFKDVIAPELATFVGATTLHAVARAGLAGLDAQVVWPPGASWDPPPAGAAEEGGGGGAPMPGPPSHVVPGSGTAVAGGYRLTDDDTHTWLSPDRGSGAWYALRIPSGWADRAPHPGEDARLVSDGQARTVLAVRRTAEPGPLTSQDAAALLDAPGRRLVGPAQATTVQGLPAVRARVVDEGDPTAPLAIGLLAVQVGPERLIITATTDDLRGAELDLVEAVALADMAVRWLG